MLRLRIKRFTPEGHRPSASATRRGATVTDFAHRLEYAMLVPGCAGGVVATFTDDQAPSAGRAGRWLDIRCGHIAPSTRRSRVVITFVDITDRKAWEGGRHCARRMTHRVKNTWRGAVDRALKFARRQNDRGEGELSPILTDRCTTLAQIATGLLGRADWGGRRSCALSAPRSGWREEAGLSVEGARAVTSHLPPDLASPFGMVLHETRTKVRQVWALSTLRRHNFADGPANGRSGAIDISWRELGARIQKTAVPVSAVR